MTETYLPTEAEQLVEDLNFWYESHQYWLDALANATIEGPNKRKEGLYKLTHEGILKEYRANLQNTIDYANIALSRLLALKEKTDTRLTFKHIKPSNYRKLHSVA